MSSAKFSVLVVEDEKLIARNISRSIMRVNNNFEVVAVASNGKDALEITEELLPNVVFTDIRMPEMDGLELANKICENFDFIICVVLSGYNDFAYAKEAIRYNVMDYLLKPINDNELSAVLSKIEKTLLAFQKDLDIENSLSPHKPEEIVELVQEYIHNHYMDVLDLGEIADRFGFSTSYLSKIFAKSSGKSPSKYIRDHRICIAKQLLRNPALSIAVIGRKVGYPDQFHFSKVFKQTTGLSPTDYRDSYENSYNSV
ncbi:MAG: response regulator [Clostridiaceae bacterium]|nr:response regulator [Clostridiaceae bacterium]